MKIVHITALRAGLVSNKNVLADDLPWDIIPNNERNGVTLRVRGGKYGDIRYEVSLDKTDLDRIAVKLKS